MCVVTMMYSTSKKPIYTFFQTMGSLLPDASMYASPEIQKNGWSTLKE